MSDFFEALKIFAYEQQEFAINIFKNNTLIKLAESYRENIFGHLEYNKIKSIIEESCIETISQIKTLGMEAPNDDSKT